MDRGKIIVNSIGVVDYGKSYISKKLDENIDLFKDIFKDDDTLKYRALKSKCQSYLSFCVIFADGMVNSYIINDNIIKPLTMAEVDLSNNLADEISTKTVNGNEVSKEKSVDKLVKAVLYGDTLVFIDGVDEALVINSKGWSSRSISEPDDDKTLRGPREGFTEGILTNISLIRRKIQSSDLKFVFKSFGTRSNTKVCISYIESLADPSVLKELNSRLSKINIDGALSSNYLVEFIKDSKFSPFKTIGTCEKPDIVASKLLEGRIALIVDGTPIVLTVPYIFIENFQSPDDYYINYLYGSMGRLLRIIGFIITISAPAVYIAMIAFHQEMLPTTIMLSVASASKGVPFPIMVECLIILFVFEILKETGVRMPNKVGHALSVVGALVVGQAAVEAQIASTITIIVIALTGITGLMNPRLQGAIMAWRLILIAAASFLGLYGYFFAMLSLMIYISSMKSFGIDYSSQLLSYRPGEQTDIFIRAPIPFMKNRPPAWLLRRFCFMPKGSDKPILNVYYLLAFFSSARRFVNIYYINQIS